MRILNDASGYGLLTRILHWSTALLIIGLVGLGAYMVRLTYFDRWYNAALGLHKAFGVCAFALGALTITSRWVSPAPAPLPSLKAWELVASRVVHRLLLAAMVLIPFSGYLVSTSDGMGIDLFGWFTVPAAFAVSDHLRDIAIKVHYYLAYGTGILALLHATAALKHQYVDRDGTLARMLWR